MHFDGDKLVENRVQLKQIHKCKPLFLKKFKDGTDLAKLCIAFFLFIRFCFWDEIAQENAPAGQLTMFGWLAVP